MSVAGNLKFLFAISLARYVAADAGDDFSNNLFSDLAPLLALFGERVTMQFMSQSMGWADNIILAMAPLGIITVIVGAIRVGGPSWLKAIIGRARQSRAIAEFELMSSTSNEVCELWNGQEVVRVMGVGPIREFIVLLPEGSGENGEQAKTKATTQTQTSSTSETGSDSVAGQRTSLKIVDQELSTVKLTLEAPESDYLKKHKPTIRDSICGERFQQDQDLEKARLGPHTQEVREDSNSEKVKARTSESGKGLEGASVIVVRNTVAQAPNLTLNAYNQFGRGELYVVAVCGIVIQFGVLIYSGFATYYPTLMFLKAGNPVADYAFPCTATGILLLVTGMLICSHVIENSTLETRYRPVAGKEARIVWLQRSETVNDQSFESFAIFPTDAQALITTSQRAPNGSRKGSGDRGLTDKIRCALLSILGAEDVQEVVAVTGTIVSICGFIVQFIGLRGMHWSASIAQLGAIAIMTTLRTWVRRNLAALPKSQPLLSGHEMDWLAMTLGGDRTKAPWLYPSKADGRKWSRPWAEDGGWDWRMTAVGDPAKCDKLKPQADGAGRNTDGSKEPLQANENGDHGMRQTPDSAIQGKGSDSRSNAHKVMKIRRDLGKLADWHGPASAEAISLARAIEVSMDALFGSLTGKFTWSLEVCGEPIHFRLEREQTGGWKAYSDEIEAALSLWLYSVHDREQGPEVDNEVDKELQVDDDRKQGEDGKENGETLRRKGTTVDDDAWLRAKGTPAKLSLRLLSLYTPGLHRDLRWWMPDGVGRVIEVEECESTGDGSTIEVETHRIVGYISNSSSGPPAKTRTRIYKARKPPESPNEDPPNHPADDREMANVIMAAESYTPLKTLFAQYMFSAFMWAAAKTMEKQIAGGADIRPTERDGMSGYSTWQSFALLNTQLSKMAQDIQSTGLGSLEEIYLSVIPPLSLEQKLPQADAIIELARQHSKRHEQLGHWKEAGDAYLWLFRTTKTFPESIATKVTAVLIEYLRTVTMAIELKEAQEYEERDIWGLKELKSILEEELKTVGQWILSSLMRLYEEQGRPWECTLVQEAGSAGEQDTSYPETFKSTKLHRLAQSPGWSAAMQIREALHDGADANSKDIHDWTPLHYAAAKKAAVVAKELLQGRADVNARDLLEWTPLHYACQGSETSIVQNLLREGADIDARGRDGVAPLHCAAMNGHEDVVSSLIEAGAAIDILDASGNTPLLWAAYKGHEGVTKYLWQDANKKLRDHNGRTALHLAVTARMVDVVKLLVESGAEKEAKDRYGRKPLHSAALSGHAGVVKLLVESGAEKEAQDRYDRMPLHWAALGGHAGVVKLLIEKGANKEAEDPDGRTPLHWAANSGHADVVKLLIEKGAEKEAQDGDGWTPLHWAANSGHADVVKLLIEKGADKEAQDDNGWRPLHSAANSGHADVVELLIEKGADKEAQDRDGRTPLHWAAKNGHANVVRLLIEKGADKEAQDHYGRTPLHSAAGNANIVELLQ